LLLFYKVFLRGVFMLKRLCLLLLFLSFPFMATTQTFKIATQAPRNSPWIKPIYTIGEELYKISNNKIKLKIYPSGVAGSEADVVRKIRIGQLDGGTLTGVGLAKIAPEVFSLSLPLLIKDDKEFEFVLNKVKDEFAKKMEKKGFIIVTWFKAGWLYLFSKNPVFYPDDLKSQALAISVGDQEIMQSWRTMGYKVVPIATNDILAGLQSGMIDSYYSPPWASLQFQWFGIANNMCSIKFSPLVMGLVMRKRSWNKLSPALKKQFLEIAKVQVDRFDEDLVEVDQEHMDMMLDNGLRVNQISNEALKVWEKDVVKGYDVFVGQTFSKDFFIRLKAYIKEYRTN
jgi:TRAP-type C4-dicarboxylate transport system substrate-binding protein